MLTVLVFTVIGQALFPIELCVGIDMRKTIWFDFMYIDAVCLHSTIWATQSYLDLMSHTVPSKRSLIHQSKTLNLLQSRLTQDGQESISDRTIAVVVVLVLNTALAGDLKSAVKHMTGLALMVSMRGELEAFKNNMQLENKICRADLSIAMATGRAPLLVCAVDVNWSRMLADVDDKRWALPDGLSTLPIDIKLLDLWADLKCFTVLANLAFQTGRKLKPEVLQETLTSVMYRAALLDVSPHPVICALHLGILAFCSTVFLQANGLKARLGHLTKQLRQGIYAMDDTEQDTPRVVKLWCLVFTGLSTVTNPDEEWFLPHVRDQAKREGAKSWNQLRPLLKKFLWIDALHDRDGKVLYNRAMA
jgi:hypothetical protein